MTHPIIGAAVEFQSDERGRKRKRMDELDRVRLDAALNAVQHQVQDPIDYARRGEVVVDLFEYGDSFDAAAATVITEILWAVQAHGFQPFDVMHEAWRNLSEDIAREKGRAAA